MSARHESQRRALYVALGLNLGMFFIESTTGILHHSTGLLADSVDMLGDTGIYALTIMAIHKSTRWQAGASLTKGITMGVLALAVLFEATHKLFFSHALPTASIMGGISVLALTVNIFCAWILLKFRSDNLNMKSVWLCSRNDALANVGVMLGGLLVALTHSAWPDAVVGLGIASIEMKSAVSIISESRRHLRVA